MANKQIIVTIAPTGESSIEAVGFEGCGCTEETERLELVLGGNAGAAKKDYKPEFSLPSSTATHNRNVF